MTSRSTPAATGNLGKTPFAHVLIYVRERGLTGTVAIQHDDSAGDLAGESLLVFDAGALAQVRLPRAIDPLGVVLRERGAITPAQLDESLRRLAAREGLQGEILVRAGACSTADVEAGLREQLRRKALRLFAPSSAPYQYHAEDLLEGYGGARFPVDVYAFLWQGVRAQGQPAFVDGIVARVGAQALRLRPGAQALAALEFSPAERPLLELLRHGPAPVETLLRAGLEPRVARAMIYTLLITKQVEPVPAGSATETPRVAEPPRAPRPSVRPPGRVSVLPPAPGGDLPLPADVPPEYRERFESARKQLESLGDQTYFQMLGVDESATPEQLNSAFLARAAAWHPDRAPAHVEALREVHARVFAQINEAQETLRDPEARRAYLAAVADGHGTPNAQRQLVNLLDAATDVQKAEVHLRRREYTQAEQLCRSALRISPDDSLALTILACSLLDRGGEAPTTEPEELLTRAVALSNRNDLAQTRLGLLAKRRGDAAKALEHFRAAATINPKNLDAVREIRLAEMRGAGATGPRPAQPEPPKGGGGGGLLSRLLKR